MTQKWNSVPLWRWHLNWIRSSDVAVVRAITNCKIMENWLKTFASTALWRKKFNKAWYSPVQNFGSSLKSPQWSMPSQYLSRGRQRPVALHGNSDILHDQTNAIKFNNKTPQALVSHRMIWKMMKNQLQREKLFRSGYKLREYKLNGACTHNYKLIINYYDYSINITRLHAF